MYIEERLEGPACLASILMSKVGSRVCTVQMIEQAGRC